MQAFAVHSHGGHTYSCPTWRSALSTKTRAYVALSVELKHCLLSLNGSLFGITATAYFALLNYAIPKLPTTFICIIILHTNLVMPELPTWSCQDYQHCHARITNLVMFFWLQFDFEEEGGEMLLGIGADKVVKLDRRTMEVSPSRPPHSIPPPLPSPPRPPIHPLLSPTSIHPPLPSPPPPQPLSRWEVGSLTDYYYDRGSFTLVVGKERVAMATDVGHLIHNYLSGVQLLRRTALEHHTHSLPRPPHRSPQHLALTTSWDCLGMAAAETQSLAATETQILPPVPPKRRPRSPLLTDVPAQNVPPPVPPKQSSHSPSPEPDVQTLPTDVPTPCQPPPIPPKRSRSPSPKFPRKQHPSPAHQHPGPTHYFSQDSTRSVSALEAPLEPQSLPPGGAYRGSSSAPSSPVNKQAPPLPSVLPRPLPRRRHKLHPQCDASLSITRQLTPPTLTFDTESFSSLDTGARQPAALPASLSPPGSPADYLIPIRVGPCGPLSWEDPDSCPAPSPGATALGLRPSLSDSNLCAAAADPSPAHSQTPLPGDFMPIPRSVSSPFQPRSCATPPKSTRPWPRPLRKLLKEGLRGWKTSPTTHPPAGSTELSGQPPPPDSREGYPLHKLLKERLRGWKAPPTSPPTASTEPSGQPPPPDPQEGHSPPAPAPAPAPVVYALPKKRGGGAGGSLADSQPPPPHPREGHSPPAPAPAPVPAPAPAPVVYAVPKKKKGRKGGAGGVGSTESSSHPAPELCRQLAADQADEGQPARLDAVPLLDDDETYECLREHMTPPPLPPRRLSADTIEPYEVVMLDHTRGIIVKLSGDEREQGVGQGDNSHIYHTLEPPTDAGSLLKDMSSRPLPSNEEHHYFTLEHTTIVGEGEEEEEGGGKGRYFYSSTSKVGVSMKEQDLLSQNQWQSPRQVTLL